MITKNEKNYSALIHLSGFSGWLFPFGSIIVPLILWTSKKDESTFIDSHGKAAVNFHLSFIIYEFLLALLIVPIAIFTLGIGVILVLFALIPIAILKIIVIILASLKANEGEYYEYPFTIALIK